MFCCQRALSFDIFSRFYSCSFAPTWFHVVFERKNNDLLSFFVFAASKTLLIWFTSVRLKSIRLWVEFNEIYPNLDGRMGSPCRYCTALGLLVHPRGRRGGPTCACIVLYIRGTLVRAPFRLGEGVSVSVACLLYVYVPVFRVISIVLGRMVFCQLPWRHRGNVASLRTIWKVIQGFCFCWLEPRGVGGRKDC